MTLYIWQRNERWLWSLCTPAGNVIERGAGLTAQAAEADGRKHYHQSWLLAVRFTKPSTVLILT